MVKKQKELDFERAFEQLEQIVNKLESGQETLEKNLELFEEGIKLTELCRSKLDDADQRIKELVKKSNDTFELKDLK